MSKPRAKLGRQLQYELSAQINSPAKNDLRRVFQPLNLQWEASGSPALPGHELSKVSVDKIRATHAIGKRAPCIFNLCRVK